MNNLLKDIDKYVDLNLSNKKYDNCNIDIKWIDNYSFNKCTVWCYCFSSTICQKIRNSYMKSKGKLTDKEINEIANRYKEGEFCKN